MSGQDKCAHIRISVLLASASALSLLGATQASAQTGETNLQERRPVDRIVVTARKREEDLQDTPIAITALSGAELDARGALSITDIAGYAPNVDISSSPSGGGGGANSQITIRGVGQSDFLLTTDPGVGVYVDGVYFARSTGGVLDLVGLARAEILRGPQGTLFGRNTIGGAINLVSERPDGDGSGFGEVTVGEFDRVDLRAGFDGTIIEDVLTFGVSALSRHADGYATRLITGEDLGDENVASLRATALWTPAPDFEMFFSADYSRARENSAAVTSIGPFNPGAGLVGLYNAVVPRALGQPAFTDPSTDSFFTTNATGPNVNESDVWGVSATADWDLNPAITLKSITAYRAQTVSFGRDGDNSPLTIRETLNFGKQHQFSQEFQILGTAFEDRLQWVGGLFYFDELAKDFNNVRIAVPLFQALEALPAPLGPPGAPCAPPFRAPGCAGNPINIGLDISQDTFLRIENTSFAAFGHATYDLTDALSVTVGGRWTRDEKDLTADLVRLFSGVTIFDGAVSDSFENFSGKVGLEYAVNEDMLAYASFSQGFKAGGFNGRPLAGNELTSFDPETLDSWEAGLKTEWLNGALIANGAVFFNQYEDIQLTAAVQDATGNLVVTVDNAAAAEILGAEFELQYFPTDRIDIFASLGWLDAEYTDVGRATTITANSELVKAPEWSGNLLARYRHPIAGFGDFIVQGDLTYTGDVFNDVQNSPVVAQDAYTLVNLRASLEPEGGDWEFAAFLRNAFDETYIVNGTDGGAFGISEAVVGRPQEWGVSVRRSF
ncbi:MAG: TonB-dependent receptor [Oceanicaulis sp.]